LAPVAYCGHLVEHAMGYTGFHSRSHDAVIGVFDEANNVIATHKHTWRFQRVVKPAITSIAFSNLSLIPAV
jgi:hypothetical protein